jgi:hypothetical protein
VIKPARDRDEYVVWSTVTESPHGYGDRAQVVELLRAGIRGSDEDRQDPETPVRNAHHWGSSARGGWTEGHWDDDFFIFKQVGTLPRAHLFEAARRMARPGGCQLWYVLELVEPFGDDDGREHYAKVLREHRDDVVSLDEERRVAGLALSQLIRTIEGWNR